MLCRRPVAARFLTVLLALAWGVVGCFGCGGDDDDPQNTHESDDDTSTDDDASTDDDSVDDDMWTDDDDAPSRTFYMASAPVQYAIAPYDVDTVFDMDGFAGRVDMVSLHVDDFFGLPWESFADDTPRPTAWVDVMNGIRDQVEALDVAVYLALTPLGGLRTTLNGQATDVDGELEIVEGWKDECYDFAAAPDAERYRDAYLAYVADMVELFDPVFLTPVIEMNMFAANCPDAFGGLVDLNNDVYDAIKATRPDLPIFPTHIVPALVGQPPYGDCAYGDDSCLAASVELLSDIKTDRLGISSYVMFDYPHADQIPADFFPRVIDAFGLKPVFGETGHSSHTIRVPGTSGCDTFREYNPQDQVEYLGDLMQVAQDYESDLVVWWSLVDYLPESMLSNCPCDEEQMEWCVLYDVIDDLGLLNAWLAWGSMGILDYEQNPKVVSTLWMEWLGRKRIPNAD